MGRSAPGGRHPSYVTEVNTHSYSLLHSYIVITIINGVFNWYALHKILVRGWLKVPFIIVSTVVSTARQIS